MTPNSTESTAVWSRHSSRLGAAWVGADGAGRSSVAVHAAGRRWRGFSRWRQNARYSFVLIVIAISFTACNKRVQPPGNESKAGGTTSGDNATISAEEAKNHIGEDAVVRGTISEIFVSKQSNNVYLYLDGDIKNAKFAAVWPGTNHPPVKGLQNLLLKGNPVEPISVSGKIITEKGVPEIIVSSWSQIN